MKALLISIVLLSTSQSFAVIHLDCWSTDRSHEVNIRLVERNDSATASNEITLEKAPQILSFFSGEAAIRPKVGKTLRLSRISAPGTEYRQLEWNAPWSGKKIFVQIHEPLGEIPKRTSGYLHFSNRNFKGSLSVTMLHCERK